jgi:hypothetical protein
MEARAMMLGVGRSGKRTAMSSAQLARSWPTVVGPGLRRDDEEFVALDSRQRNVMAAQAAIHASFERRYDTKKATADA